MSTKHSAERILCINCNIHINTLRRHVLGLDTRIISIVSSWISPIIITEEDYICQKCWENAMQTVDEEIVSDHEEIVAPDHEEIVAPDHEEIMPDHEEIVVLDYEETVVHDHDEQCAGPSNSGHTEVCLLCGLSLLNRRKDNIMKRNPSEIAQRIIDLIGSRIAPREILPSDCVCHPCWVSVKRDVRSQDVNQNQSDIPQEIQGQALEMQPHSPSVNLSLNLEEDRQAFNQNNPQKHEIVLPNYRRAPNTAARCVFPGCTNRDLHRLVDNLIATVLRDYKYYLPVHARVCGEHLRFNEWDILFNSENSKETFSAAQIEHVFSLVNIVPSFLDFTSYEAVEDANEQLFKYWLGMTKDNFRILLNEVPRISHAHRGILGLAALIIKMNTGDSNDRLSLLLNVPCKTLEKIMGNVREILLQDSTCHFRNRIFNSRAHFINS